MGLSFVFCYLPATVVKVADRRSDYPNMHLIAYGFIYLSACINPVIYVTMNRQYRRAYNNIRPTIYQQHHRRRKFETPRQSGGRKRLCDADGTRVSTGQSQLEILIVHQIPIDFETSHPTNVIQYIHMNIM